MSGAHLEASSRTSHMMKLLGCWIDAESKKGCAGLTSGASNQMWERILGSLRVAIDQDGARSRVRISEPADVQMIHDVRGRSEAHAWDM